MSNFIPNSFMVPNAIVDEALAKLSGNACKIYLLIVRKTRGWNKPADFISFSQIRKFTGISSNETINKAMDELVNYGLVKVKNGNQKTSNEYYINDFGITENVKAITENEVYLGHKIYGKIQASLYEGKKKSRMPRDQWTIIENDHEPIIDQESFDIVHNKRVLINEEFHEAIERNKHLENTENIFKDLAKCGDCKSNLVRRRHIKKGEIEYYYFLCTTFESNNGCKCSRKYIFEDELKAAVYETIKNEIELVNDIDKIIDKVMAENKRSNQSNNIALEIKKTKIEIEKLQAIRTTLFDDYLEQLLTEQEYLYAKNDYDKKEEKFRNRLDELFLEQSRFAEVYTHENKYLTAFRRFMDAQELSRELLTALVHSIELKSDKNIHINFKFKDAFEELRVHFRAQGIEVKPYE